MHTMNPLNAMESWTQLEDGLLLIVLTISPFIAVWRINIPYGVFDEN